MLADDMGRFKVPVKPFTPTFFKNLSEEGFTSSKTHADFVLYYQFSKKLKGLVSASQSLIVVIMAKDDALDFYSDYINEEIEKIYKKHQEIKRVKNQIVLQFKKYGKYSEDAKKEADQIINFHQVNGTLLHITCGLFVDEGTIYYLRPKKAYPNRYYYYASETIKRLCEVKIEPNEIK